MPVRPSTFVTNDKLHESYNVEVDLSAIGAFGFARRRKVEATLFADLQCNADGNIVGRLGSGRSGYFEGKYLKGIGRTQLAANWAGDDRYHSSGHLLPSSAAREYLVSTFVEAAGAIESINACEGVLVRELPDPDIDWLAGLRGPGTQLYPADLRLQAISVKDGRFARLSNFLWSLGQFGLEPGWISTYFLAVRRTLGGDDAWSMQELDVTAAEIVRGFESTIGRGFRAFEAFRRIGVDWGSTHNNFTADGRFLDLEVPVIYGEPFIGWVSLDGRNPRAGYWAGLEIVSYVRQMRDFIVAFRARLRNLPRYRFASLEVEFLRELVNELDCAFSSSHILFDSTLFKETMLRNLTDELGLSKQAQADLRIILDDEMNPQASIGDAAWETLKIRRLTTTMRFPEGGPALILHAPSSLVDCLPLTFERGKAVDFAVHACDNASSIANYFDALEMGRRQILASCSR